MSRTIDHGAVRRWAEERGGRPAVAPLPDGDALEIDFSTYKGEPGSRAISWDEFFARFEAEALALDYDTGQSPAGPSRFYRLVPRRGEDRRG